jgi:hypothetical protein
MCHTLISMNVIKQHCRLLLLFGMIDKQRTTEHHIHLLLMRHHLLLPQTYSKVDGNDPTNPGTQGDSTPAEDAMLTWQTGCCHGIHGMVITLLVTCGRTPQQPQGV